MFYFPSLRRLLLPALIGLTLLLIYRSQRGISKAYLSSLLIDEPVITPPGERIAVADLHTKPIVIQKDDGTHAMPDIKHFYDFGEPPEHEWSESLTNHTEDIPRYIDPAKNNYLKPLLECRNKPNRFTNHIRIRNAPIRKITMTRDGNTENEKRSFLNAAILSLPYWSDNQYLLVTRVQTDGSLQLNIICEANICYTDPALARPGEKPCDEEDLRLLDGTEGMRCATPPLTLNVPPTPAKSCGNGTGVLMDIPGFHDPRIFWSGKGEPLMMMNTQSRYACFGLWVIDLRTLHFRLNILLGSNPKLPTLGPLPSYQTLTEITKNPPESRGQIEKNWFFFSNSHSSYIHYDIDPKSRSFAKLLGQGLTTVNLTDPLEQPCVIDGAKPKEYETWGGSWHQGTNSLRLILCDRQDHSCRSNPMNTVYWSLIHHKHKNYYSLPLRYERYFIVFASTPPFNMLAMSTFPVLLANETASGWNSTESWDDDPDHQKIIQDGGEGKENFAGFTYTVSIGYSWGRKEDTPEEKNVGFLDDEVVLGLGIDDESQGYARAKVAEPLTMHEIVSG